MGPTADKKVSNAKRRRKEEEARIQREAKKKKELRQMYNDIDQWMQ